MKFSRNKKYYIFFLSGFIVIVLLFLDYRFGKVVPNFFFLDSFTKQDVVAYWKGIISVVVAMISLLTFFQTSDKFFHEKRVQNENQKKETIRKYQDLVKTAIDILSDSSEEEGACIFAVQIMQNIASLYNKSEFISTLEKQSEPFQIISIEGIVCLLKRHLDRVLSVERRNDEIRQDIVQIISFLYIKNNDLWTQDDLKRCGAHSFKNLYINMEYLDGMSLENMEFVNTIFDCNNEYVKLYFDGKNVFKDCTFNCDYDIYLKKNGTIAFRNCGLQGLRMIEFNDVIKNKEMMKGTKNVEFVDTDFKGYVSLSDNLFDRIVINACRFDDMVHMHRIKVNSEMIVSDTNFLNGLDFQGSIFERRIMFERSVCKNIFYFWETKFYKKDRVEFTEFYVDEFPVPNWRTEIYEDKNQSMLETKKYSFIDLFEIIQGEETINGNLLLRRDIVS